MEKRKRPPVDVRRSKTCWSQLIGSADLQGKATTAGLLFLNIAITFRIGYSEFALGSVACFVLLCCRTVLEDEFYVSSRFSK